MRPRYRKVFTAFWALGRMVLGDKVTEGYLSTCTAFVISMALEELFWTLCVLFLPPENGSWKGARVYVYEIECK